MTDESVEVARIELSFKDPAIFASGLDSTQLVVRLYDKSDAILTTIDPTDLTLSCSEDIEAMPFTLKQGIYKTVLLPRVKSPDVKMQVDWKGRVKSPIVVLESTTAPIKNNLLPINHEFIEAKAHGEVMVGRGSRFPASGSEEFSFVNVGINKIVKRSSSSRAFNFEYPEHARQNIAMQIDDAPNEVESDGLHSYFMFFPRTQLPILEQKEKTLVVTLPTGERVIFDKESKVIISGVFEEGAVDGHSNRFKRSYAQLKYTGRGVVLRTNATGSSPQFTQHKTKQIDMVFGSQGSDDVLIINGTTGEKCIRPKEDFWDNLDVAPIEFKFPTDEEFEIYLQNNCSFGLPKF